MIRKLLSLGFAAALAISAIAQTTATNVPAQVQNAFRTKFPNVSAVTWSEESGYYKPAFTVNGEQTIGYIDIKGHVLQTTVKLTAAALPPAAATYISQNYANAPVGEAGRIDYTGTTTSRFYAVVSGQQLIFDNKGSFIKISTNLLKQ